MKIYYEGEKSKGICKKCKRTVATTFKVSSVPLSHCRNDVKDILVAKCDVCNHIISIPHQSSPKVREALKSKKYSIEVRIPIQLLDILILATDQFGIGKPELMKDCLIKYYIALAGVDKKMVKNLNAHLKSDLAQGSGYRLSLKINEAIYNRFDSLMKETGLNKTQLIKGLILQINQDVLQTPNRKRMIELDRVMLASA